MKISFKILSLALLFSIGNFCYGEEARAADQNIYISSSASPDGDGSILYPYDSFLDINWTTSGDNSIFDWVANEDDVFINLKKGDVFAEQLIPGTGGLLAHRITITAYGEGNNPEINLGYTPTEWVGPDENGVYTSTSLITSLALYEDDLHLRKASDITLSDGNVSFANSGVIKSIYYKPTSGVPADHMLNTVGNPGLVIDAYSHFNIFNIDFKYVNIGIRLLSDGVSNIDILNCNFYFLHDFGINIENGSAGYFDFSYNNFDYMHNGIYVHGINENFNSIISYNTMKRCGYDGTWNGDGHAIGVQFANNLLIQSNIIENCLRPVAFWSDNTAYPLTNIEISKNLIKNNKDGIGSLSSDGAAISSITGISNLFYSNKINYNIFINNDFGFYFTRAQDLEENEISNNLYINNTYGSYFTKGADYYNLENNIYYNNNVHQYWNGGIQIGDNILADKNIYFSDGSDKFFYKSESASNNFSDWKVDSSQDIESIISNPLLISTTDFSLQSTSPAIDAGTNTSLTSDYAGNPIYGTPDIGAYEYQPPYTTGTDEIDIQAGARIYADGKFRDLTTTSGLGADLTIIPENNFEDFTSTESRPQWLDITNLTWTAGEKEWTESSDDSSLTNTIHTVGDLTPAAHYYVAVDDTLGSTIEGENCAESICQANSQGKIAFTYTGTYSTHTFNITPREGEIVTELTDADLEINRGEQETLDEDKRFYFDKDETKLKGEDSTIVNGEVKIYKNGKKYATAQVDENGKWDKKISFGHNRNYEIKLKFYDQHETLRDTKEYTLKIDTEGPVFEDQERKITKNQTISFSANDEDSKIDYYKVKLLDDQGHILRSWKKQKKATYSIPEKVKDQAKTIVVRAYDKAGNKTEQTFEVGLGTQSLSSDVSGQVEVQGVQTTKEEQTEAEAEVTTSIANELKETTTAPTETKQESPEPTPVIVPKETKDSHWYNPFSWF